MKKSLLFHLIFVLFVSCNRAKDPQVDNTSQFVGTYTEDVTGTSAVTMSIKRIDNNRFIMAYRNSLLDIQFECKITFSGSVPALVENATFFEIPQQNVITLYSNETLIIKGKPIDSRIPTQHGYLWHDTTGKIRLTFSAEVAGLISQTILFTGIKN